MELKNEVQKINSRDDFIEFVNALRYDLSSRPEEWQNATLNDFLEALSAWVRDMDGYYINNNLPVPNLPSWRNFAEMLLAAKFYE